jgi:hypothetical protein
MEMEMQQFQSHKLSNTFRNTSWCPGQPIGDPEIRKDENNLITQ